MEGAAMAGEAAMGAADAGMAMMPMMAATPAMTMSFLLPGIGLGLLKGLFLAELLKQRSPKSQKGYGHHQPYGHQQ